MEIDDTISTRLFGKLPNRTFKFLDKTDSDKNYKKNVKLFGSDWYYFAKDLTYHHNSNGFRTKEFANIDWANSIVVFGDSYTYGEGNLLEDCYTSLLEDMTGIPVINLGIGASGIDRSCWNSLALYENYPKPKALIHLWSSLDRYSEYDYLKNEWLHNTPGRRGFCGRHEWHLRSIFYVKTDRALWRGKVPYIEAGVFEDTVKQLKVDEAKIIDKGRDNMHWGPKSNAKMAEYFSNRLKELSIV